MLMLYNNMLLKSIKNFEMLSQYKNNLCGTHLMHKQDIDHAENENKLVKYEVPEFIFQVLWKKT